MRVTGKPNCLYSSSELTDTQEEIFLNSLDRLKDEELEEFLSKALEINKRLKRYLKVNKAAEETDSDMRDGIKDHFMNGSSRVVLPPIVKKASR